MSELGGSKLTNIIKAKEDMNKSEEQLEHEKREIIKSRLIKLRLDGESKDKLARQAKNFHELLGDLYDLIYDLNEKHERQKYDMMELTKRAIQVEKGKSKTRKSNIVHTGLGGSIFPWLAEVAHNAPGKISLFSRYERVTDRRSFANRREIWEKSEKEEDERHKEPKRVQEKPKPKPVVKKPEPVPEPIPEPEPVEEEHHEEPEEVHHEEPEEERHEEPEEERHEEPEEEQQHEEQEKHLNQPEEHHSEDDE